jgi:hypothetical protein
MNQSAHTIDAAGHVDDSFRLAEPWNWTGDNLGLEPPRPVVGGAQTVPLAQFNALLYQHNVLRERLSGVTDYLDGCDRLLGEMVKTIALLEERTRQLEPSRATSRATGRPLSGALQALSAGFNTSRFARSAAQ